MRDSHPRPPGPAWSPYETYRRRRRDVLGMLTEAARTHAGLVHLRVLNKSAYLVSDPGLIREVLVARAHSVKKGRGFERAEPFLGTGLLTNEGEVHRRHRRMLQPAFHKARIHGYGELMVSAAQRLGWEDARRIDVAEEMGRLTLSVATGALFGTDLEPAEMAKARNAIHEFVSLFNLPGWSRALRRPARQRRRFDTMLTGLLDRRERSGGNDFLSMLLESGLSDVEILDEARTFVTAGHESTANSLTWMWWLLDRHPAVVERMVAEVSTRPEPLTADDFGRLPYIRAAVAEAVRLYPPLYVISRRAREPIELGGWTVPAGDRLLTSPYVTHRDPRWWGPDAGAFRPERWLDASGQFGDTLPGQPRGAYFPFGAGPRVCIGEPFAWMESVLMVGTLIRRWHVTVAADPRPLPGFTLRTDGPVPAVVRRRGKP